jgi:hypothetical protein
MYSLEIMEWDISPQILDDHKVSPGFEYKEECRSTNFLL